MLVNRMEQCEHDCEFVTRGGEGLSKYMGCMAGVRVQLQPEVA